jgi:POT family proton-dependent oligopeptide transporter
VKFGIGMAGVALAWVFIALTGASALTPVIFWLTFYLIQDWSYAAFIEPQVQAVVSRDAPSSVTAIMMSMIKMSTAASYIFAGWLGRFYEPLGAQKFFLLVAAVAGAATVTMVVPYRWWVRRLGPAEVILES